MKLSLFLTFSVTAMLASCSNPGAVSMSDEKTVVVKENAQPKDAYQLTMTIENAPGPFGLVDGSAQYDVENRSECGQRNPASGTVGRMTHMPDLQWRSLSENVYVATVHADMLIDEDYFGNGLCRWRLMGVSGLLRATGDNTETRFLPALDANEIRDGRPVKLYFWKGYYPHVDMSNFADLGQKDMSKVPENKRAEFFSITMVAKEIRL